MIREFTIENFKSIESLTLPLGRVTVLIGENGAGKSNILEAMSYFTAAVHEKLDSEFLFARGVRVVRAEQTLSGFNASPKAWRTHAFRLTATGKSASSKVDILVSDHGRTGGEYESWMMLSGPPKEDQVIKTFSLDAELSNRIDALKSNYKPTGSSSLPDDPKELARYFISRMQHSRRDRDNAKKKGLKLFTSAFLTYSPENTALRTFEAEGQIRPLGVRGEGLFKLVQYFAEHQPAKFKLLRKELRLFDWFEDFAIPKRLGIGESRLEIKDRFLAAKRLLDQRSANEGFLFLLFYLCLFLSPQTPKFFAIDNIDASLNPKLCAEMMRRLVALAKQEDKQVIITTHNPAILDGLDLTDKEQLLYAIQRDEKGRTIAQRIPAPKPQPGEPALKLSHAYLRGLLGGVPKNF